MKTSSGTLPSAFRISMGLLSAGIVLIFGAWFILANHAYAATLVQSATASKLSNQASPTVVTAIFPTAATAGHLLIAVVGARGTATITGPATWTSAINQSGNPSQAIFYKIASGGETDVTATVNANPGSIGLALFEYAGSEVTLAQTSSSTGNNATPGSGSITTSDANELVLAAFTLANNKAITDTSWNDAGEGFTELTDIGTTGPGRAAEYATGNNLANGIGPHSVIVASAGPANWRGQIVGFRVRAFATNVTSSLANGSYAVGQVVPVQMTFNRAVTVDTSGGTPDLHLNNGGNALYASGSGTATLTFNYTVGDGEDVADLDYGSTSALQLSGGVVQDDAHNDISLALPALGGAGSLAANKNIAINTTVPSFTMQYYSDSGLTQSLGSTPRLKAGTYYLAVTADEALNAVPTVSLAAEGTANDVTGAAMTLVSGTTYRYARTVSFDASAVGSVLESVSVTGSDLAGNTSTGAHPANMATAAAYTDTVAPDVPTVAAIAGDNYIKNDEKNAILVTGTAEAGSLVSITLSDGSNSTTGTQQLGSASTDFSLTLDGTAASPSPLADGTITPSVTATDAAGNASVATTTPTATQDSVAPSLTAVRVASNNADPTKAKPGDTVTLTITGNEPLRSPAVIFHGAPIDMTGSGADWTANRVMTTADTEGPITFSVSYFDAAGNTGPPVAATTDGSSVTYDRTPPSVAEVTPVATPSSNGSPSYTFSSTEAGSIAYGGSCTSATADAAVGNNTVTFGPYGSDGTHADCTIRVTDQAGNMSATLNVSSFTTDISDPAVTEVASDAADGTYGLNALIEIHVLFNENVFVTGSPSIALNASGGAVAPYLGGSGTSMLEFLYAVQSGDASSDLDYASTDALALNGGTIRDSVDRNAALLLPSPGSAGSLGANKNIVIDAVPPDTTQPNVSGVSSASPSGTYGAGASIPIHVQFDENVAVTGTPQLNLNVGGGRIFDRLSKRIGNRHARLRLYRAPGRRHDAP